MTMPPTKPRRKGRPDIMTLPEFVAEQRHRLDEFFEMWFANMEDNPADYPGEMSPGEWDEQLEVFHVVP